MDAQRTPAMGPNGKHFCELTEQNQEAFVILRWMGLGNNVSILDVPMCCVMAIAETTKRLREPSQ